MRVLRREGLNCDDQVVSGSLRSKLLGLITADISFGVIHDRAKRPRKARRSEVVNNSAVGENSAGGRPASVRSRSYRSDPQRIEGRLPGEPEALAKTSNRTKPQEGHYISSTDGRAKGRQHQKKAHYSDE